MSFLILLKYSGSSKRIIGNRGIYKTPIYKMILTVNGQFYIPRDRYFPRKYRILKSGGRHSLDGRSTGAISFAMGIM